MSRCIIVRQDFRKADYLAAKQQIFGLFGCSCLTNVIYRAATVGSPYRKFYLIVNYIDEIKVL
jgi:hypothetical protein